MWKKQYGVEGQNLAKVFADRCFEQDLGIYRFTNEPMYWRFGGQSRFHHVLKDSEQL